MTDLSEPVKAAMIAKMENSPVLTALVPAQRIYPMQTAAKPEWPFIRFGQPSVRGYEQSCGAGVEMDVRIHAFANGEDSAQKVAAAVVAALDGMPELMICDWRGTQWLPDEEADQWHAVIDFSVAHVA